MHINQLFDLLIDWVRTGKTRTRPNHFGLIPRSRNPDRNRNHTQNQPDRFDLDHESFRSVCSITSIFSSLKVNEESYFNSRIDKRLISRFLSVAYHLSFQMISHRMKIARSNIIKSNLCLKWWDDYARLILFTLLVIALIFEWTFSMTLINLLSQITYLTSKMSWLQNFNRISTTLLDFFQEILSQMILIIFLILISMLIRFLAQKRDFFFITSIELIVQKFYFMFLFVRTRLSLLFEQVMKKWRNSRR